MEENSGSLLMSAFPDEALGFEFVRVVGTHGPDELQPPRGPEGDNLIPGHQRHSGLCAYATDPCEKRIEKFDGRRGY